MLVREKLINRGSIASAIEAVLDVLEAYKLTCLLDIRNLYNYAISSPLELVLG